LISLFVPLVLLSMAHTAATREGVVLLDGCDGGPDAVFGALSGLMFCAFLRLGYCPFFDV
jgi:hypothetical protein